MGLGVSVIKKWLCVCISSKDMSCLFTFVTVVVGQLWAVY